MVNCSGTVAIATKSTETGIACELVNPQWLQAVPERWTGDEYEKVKESLQRRVSTKAQPTKPARCRRSSPKGKSPMAKRLNRARRKR
ncbi:unnamed protein product [Anisakis simplex]|uniref:Transposase n=1 Tax=Anisakis simplex TaxID=6269 RepID=A0A0M3KBR3_ANISI|nr:unnamed protein product [Anisakis simplex]